MPAAGLPATPRGGSGGGLVRLSLSLVVLCLAVLPTLTNAALFSPNTKVTMLTANNFKKEVLDIDKPTMVAFTAPWCGHCQRLVPEYEKAAKQLDGVVKLANIDCDEDKNKPICGQYGVQGFPTLKMFPPTKKRLPRDYQGARTAKDIAAALVDTLPMGAKKLRAEELKDYCDKEPEKPKVLLFSTKPTSSALYKSLALDFRTSLSFAFLRGDQATVRATSRAVLSTPIDEKDLPVLLVVPGRADGTSLSEAKPLKYDGKLSYHDLHKWLVDNVPEAKSKKTASSSSKGSTKAKAKAKAKVSPKAKTNDAAAAAKKKSAAGKKAKTASKEDDEVKLPPGAQYEWRAENEPASKEKLENIAQKLNKAAQRTKEEAEKAAAAAGQAYESVKQKVFDAGSGSDDPASSATYTEKSDASGSEQHSSSSWSSSSSYSSTTDENGQTTEDTDASYSSSSSADPKEHSYRVSSHRVSPSAEERASLKEQLTKWLDGQEVDWSSEYAEQFEKAAAEAQELMDKDPEAAMEAAAKGEEFLLSHLVTDLAMMEAAREKGNTNEAISDDKIEGVRKMVKELTARIADRNRQKAGHDEL